MTELIKLIHNTVNQLFDFNFQDSQIQFQQTRKEFEGDITLVVFPLVKVAKKSPEETGKVIGEGVVKSIEEIESFNVIKGFLNLKFTDTFWKKKFSIQIQNPNWGIENPNSSNRTILVEYSSPNTNKPLHLGHLRNNFLGYSVAEILKANGHDVKKVQVINDRGIHICKSMVAWQLFGNGETPENTGLKGDKLIGNYYVKFDKEYKNEIANLIEEGLTEDEAKKQAPLMQNAQQMLVKWEQGDEETVDLWKKMNSWVYSGFDVTYKTMGVDFDKLYYESETFLLGKNIVQKGLDENFFFKKEDGSIWIDLKNDGLDEKLLLRSDGTAVYMTQDIGTAVLRKQDFPAMDQLIYTVGNEQDYHFKVLFKILEKLGYDFAQNCFHLSYGMVDLPSGKMKSREGTVVDADDLMEDMFSTAQATSEELGKLEDASEEEKQTLYKNVGLAALKYFILKVDPKKRMLFNPEESVDFNGNTGPFIQYTYARIQALKRRKGNYDLKGFEGFYLELEERELIKKIEQFPDIIKEAGAGYSPAIIANYIYDLVKIYNQFYQSIQIFGTEKEDLRIALSHKCGEVIKSGMKLLGIDVPERM
jgi:arginyl-tRNA synthetase